MTDSLSEPDPAAEADDQDAGPASAPTGAATEEPEPGQDPDSGPASAPDPEQG